MTGQAFVAECLLAKIQVSLALKSPDVVDLLQDALTRRGEFPPLTVALIALDPEFDGLRITPNVYTTVDEVDLFADRVLDAIRKGMA